MAPILFTGLLPAWPVANSSTLSLVEVSPSTVTQLKLRSVTSESSFCKTGASMAASVKTKPSMVAMSGAIIPEPLQKPLMVTVVSPITACRVAALGKVSVVMIARAASDHAVSERPASTAGRCWGISLGGIGWPITPVEATKT